MLTPPARWCLLEGTILIGWYRNGNRKNHPPTCKLRAGGFVLCDRKSYKTREEAIAVLRDMVKRKKEMEAKAQIEFAKARKEAANCYASL